MKFLVDMPLSPGLIAWLRQNGYQADHVSDLGIHKASDLEILQRAYKEELVVITADLDFPRLLAHYQSKGPALILFRGGNFNEKETIALLEKVLKTLNEEDLRNSIIVVEKERVRRRALPITPSERQH